ncbi:hypothetical protein TDB9533_03640 [Thalassocella blandensis]|nr:hypothetical protein TDB9533_03640 [Thalassocella blandensis]
MDSTLQNSLQIFDFLTLLGAVVVTFTQYVLGYLVIDKLQCLGARTRLAYKTNFMKRNDVVPLAWLLGLLLHLALALLGKCLLLPWSVVTMIPAFVILLSFFVSRESLFNALAVFSNSLSAIFQPTFIIWCAFHCVLGYSLFFVAADIKTPWVNNYGDLTFHLGMISHFTFVGDFPAQYHLYAGERLSYPFFINFWSAMLWWPSSELVSLPWLFAWQWLLLWSVIFVFLNGKKFPLLPWSLVFGGGSYFAITAFPEAYSWSKINDGYPFTTWLSTIWVTQRSAMLGVAASLACVWLLLNKALNEAEDKTVQDVPVQTHLHFIIIGILLGLMPLAHTHFFIFTALFIGLYLGLPAVVSSVVALRGGQKTLTAVFLSREWIQVLCVVAPSLLALCFFPLLLGKSGMISLMPGWSIPLASTVGEGVTRSAYMWVTNAPQWLFAFLLVVIFSQRRFAVIVLIFLFLVGNFIKLAVWEWDQLKVFLAVFAMFLCVFGQLGFACITQPWVNRVLTGMFCLVLSGPGIYELYRIVKESPNYQVYSPDKLVMAKFIREQTASEDIIVSATDHNAAATLSGRTMYMGYQGTLASHKINYQQRERIARNLSLLSRCQIQAQADAENCPTFVVWDQAALKLWRNQKIPAEFTRVTDEKFPGKLMYRIGGKQ